LSTSFMPTSTSGPSDTRSILMRRSVPAGSRPSKTRSIARALRPCSRPWMRPTPRVRRRLRSSASPTPMSPSLLPAWTIPAFSHSSFPLARGHRELVQECGRGARERGRHAPACAGRSAHHQPTCSPPIRPVDRLLVPSSLDQVYPALAPQASPLSRPLTPRPAGRSSAAHRCASPPRPAPSSALALVP